MAWSPHFLDNFNRANSTTVGNDWLQGISSTSGVTYGIISNACGVTTSPAAVRQFAIHLDSTAGYTRAVQTKMVLTPNTLALWVGRRDYTAITTAGNGYGYYAFISIFNGTATILRGNGTTAATTLTSLSSIPVTTGTHYRLEHTDAGVLTFMSSPDGASWTTHGTATDTTYMSGADTASYGVGSVISTSTVTARKDGTIDDFTVEELAGTTYTVTYDEQGGAAVTDVTGALQFTPPTTTKSGYYFDGWNTAADGSGTAYAAGTLYALTANLTLYAIWNSYGKVGIFLGGTTGAQDGSLDVEGDGIGVSLTAVNSVITAMLRCPSGVVNAGPITATAPTDCAVSSDGTTYDATATFAAGSIGDTNTPLYIKRITDSGNTTPLALSVDITGIANTGLDPAIDFAGAGTEADPYLIATAQQFTLVGEQPDTYLDNHFKLTADIDFGGATVKGWGREHPDGNKAALWVGGLDGNGKKLSNLVIDTSRTWPNGSGKLFYLFSSAMTLATQEDTCYVKNLTVEDISATRSAALPAGVGMGVFDNIHTVTDVAIINPTFSNTSHASANAYTFGRAHLATRCGVVGGSASATGAVAPFQFCDGDQLYVTGGTYTSSSSSACGLVLNMYWPITNSYSYGNAVNGTASSASGAVHSRDAGSYAQNLSNCYAANSCSGPSTHGWTVASGYPATDVACFVSSSLAGANTSTAKAGVAPLATANMQSGSTAAGGIANTSTGLPSGVGAGVWKFPTSSYPIFVWQ